MASVNAVTQIGAPPLRIDLLAAISGVTFADVYDGADDVELEGHRLRIIGLPELIANKRASGRPKDTSDIRRLRAISGRAKRRS